MKMMKRWNMRLMTRLLVLMFTLASVSALAIQPDFHIGGGVGVARYGDDFYLSTSVYPDIHVGKLGLGLELTLNIGPEGIRAQDWDTLGKVLGRSVRYVRWAHKGDPLYLLFGTLYNAEIGTGILVGNYTNLSPTDTGSGIRRLGLVADVDMGLGGLESLVSDTLASGVHAVRLYVRPASFGQRLSAMNALTIGVSMARDGRGGYPYNELSAVAVDAYHPLHPMLELYAHAASIKEHGAGEGVGFRGRIGALRYRAELRRMDAGFVPTPFSKGYEGGGIDWSKYPADGPPTVGYLAGAEVTLLGGGITGSVQHEVNKAAGSSRPRLTAVLAVQGPGLRAITGRESQLRATYTQESAALESSDLYRHLGAQARVAIVHGVDLNYSYDVVFPYGEEPQRAFSMGVSFGK
jgi:hypothetical protein